MQVKGPLLEEIVSPPALARAWEHVRSADAEDGVVSASVVRFGSAPDDALSALHERLVSGDYQPGPLAPVTIPKDDGGGRVLLIGGAGDRVVERAVAVSLGRFIDPLLSPASFAFRPGTGVGDAVRRVVELREEGYDWVARADIDDCFDSIPPRRVLWRLAGMVGDARVLDLVARFLDPSRRPLRLRSGRGVPQGGALSPLLANVYLDELDQALLLSGFPTVRYADDLCVMARSKGDATEAVEVARKAAERLDLRLGAEDTSVVSFAEGFVFLGEEFNERYPTSEEAAPVLVVPDELTLYVTLHGSYVRLRRGRVEVRRDDRVVLDVPCRRVGRLVVGGSVTLSAGVRSWALGSGIGVVLLSRRGTLLGILEGGESRDAARKRRQYAATDDEQACLVMARALASAKMRHQRTLLMRFNRRETSETVAEAVAAMKRTADMVGECREISEVNGIEGAVARAYWRGFAALLGEEVEFAGRNRRPPTDVVNAALSYAYAVLESECRTALAATGLDPGVGFMHSDERGRSSLALDLMEEFRPLIVDQVVLEAFRRRSLAEEHGRRDSRKPGVFLTERGKRTLLEGLERRLLQAANAPRAGGRVSQRGRIQAQARQLAEAIDSRRWEYRPVSWR